MSNTTPDWVAGPEFRKAMEMATEKHADHARKTDREPYLGHLLAVASNVIEAGGTETQAAAALLHDSIEDRDCTVHEIATRVSPAVAAIVGHCSEPPFDEDGENRQQTWWKRKQNYLSELARFGDTRILDPSVLVALADKVNNCEKTARDLHRHIHVNRLPITTFWEDFNAGDSCQEAWYRGLVAGFTSLDLGTDRARALLRRLETAVSELFDGREVVQCTVNHGHQPRHPERFQ